MFCLRLHFFVRSLLCQIRKDTPWNLAPVCPIFSPWTPIRNNFVKNWMMSEPNQPSLKLKSAFCSPRLGHQVWTSQKPPAHVSPSPQGHRFGWSQSMHLPFFCVTETFLVRRNAPEGSITGNLRSEGSKTLSPAWALPKTLVRTVPTPGSCCWCLPPMEKP